MAKILIECPKCKKHKNVDRVASDPPKAVLVVTLCDNCSACDGGFDDVSYYDIKGNEVIE